MPCIPSFSIFSSVFKRLITPLLVISWAKIDYSEFENPRKNFNKEKLLIELVSYFMQRGHFSPKNLNNNLLFFDRDTSYCNN